MSTDDPHSEHDNQLTFGEVHTEGGDFVGQDKIGGDKIGGDKVEGNKLEAYTYIEHATYIAQPAEKPKEIADAPAPGETPYKGLQYFDVGDVDLFFGREALTAKLVGRLRDQRFLAIVGGSGSGKSSVVRAGLIPALQREEPLADGTLPPHVGKNWQVRIITPTAHPLKELASCLTRDLETITATTTLMDDLASDSRCLDLAVTKTLKRLGGERLILVVDQFEELFTLCSDQNEIKAFIDNLIIASAEETAGPTVVVITLRADFYHHCVKYDNLRDLMERYQVIIGAMTLDDLRRAIEEPARKGDWGFEEGLVDLMLQDVGMEPGALPLLSHALLETWKRRKGRIMTLVGYQDAGGVRGAIAQTAERIYQSMTTMEQKIARNIFLQLTELGESATDTRRRASLDELVPVVETRNQVESVLKVLADKRLITTTEDSAEVAHEALIREWPTLRKWLEEDREYLRIHRHLSEAARAWESLGRDDGDLYRGARLTQSKEWSASPNIKMTLLEQEFLQASWRARDFERTRRLGIVAIVAFSVVAIAVGLTLAATGQFNLLLYRPLPVDWVTIPAGEFLMGSSESDPNADVDQLPQHAVYLDSYQIMKYEVTHAQYVQCVRAGVCRRPSSDRHQDENYLNHPIVYVNWEDADNFCAWSGARLPSEAEWEKAARGGLEEMQYPWGDQFPDCSIVNFRVGGKVRCVDDSMPVGSYPPNGYGLYDMAGNVWEWVADFYDENYYTFSPTNNPTGPDRGYYRDRVMRGGSWESDEFNVRAAFRRLNNPDNWSIIIGFRCARTP